MADRSSGRDEAIVRAALLAAFGAPADQGLALTPIPQLEAELSGAVALANGEATERVATNVRAAFTQPPVGDRRGLQLVDAQAGAALDGGGQLRQQRPAVVIPLRRPTHRRRRQAVVGAAVALSTIIGSAGVAAASTSSMPGEELYGVKRAVEDVWGAVAPIDHNAEARVRVRLAQRRLQEVGDLRARGAGRQVIDHALIDADDQIARARRLQPVQSRTIATLQLEREQLTPQAPAVSHQGVPPPLTPASGSTTDGPSGPAASPVPAAASTTPARTGDDSMTDPAAAPATPTGSTVTGPTAGSASTPAAAGRPSGSPTSGQVVPLAASPSQPSPASPSSPGPLDCGTEWFPFPSATTATPPPTSTPSASSTSRAPGRRSSASAPALPPAPTVNGQDGAAATALAKRCAAMVAAPVLTADLFSQLQGLLVARGYDASVARKVARTVSGAPDSVPMGR